MWKILQNDPPFYIQFLPAKVTGYEILVTDYTTLYSKFYLKNEFLVVLKKSNSKLEIADNELIDKATDMLITVENFKDLKISTNNTGLCLSICKMYIFPLRLKLELQEDCKEAFFNRVTKPLLKTIKDLQSVEKQLRHSLKEKDEEIEKYKEEGARIKKHWRTTTFNEEEYLKNNNENGAMSKDFPESLLESKEEKVKYDIKVENSLIVDSTAKPEESLTTDVGTIPIAENKQEIKREAISNSSYIPSKKKQRKLNL